jgi:hypothetical protein
MAAPLTLEAAMKLRTILLTACTLASSHAYAADAPGRWMDTRNHILFGDLPEGSEPVARLQYAKVICHQREGTQMGGTVTARFMPCMKSQGFAWLPDSPAEIAAREKAIKDAQWRDMLGDLGQALLDSQPRRCSGRISPNGSFHTECW